MSEPRGHVLFPSQAVICVDHSMSYGSLVRGAKYHIAEAWESSGEEFVKIKEHAGEVWLSRRFIPADQHEVIPEEEEIDYERAPWAR